MVTSDPLALGLITSIKTSLSKVIQAIKGIEVQGDLRMTHIYHLLELKYSVAIEVNEVKVGQYSPEVRSLEVGDHQAEEPGG